MRLSPQCQNGAAGGHTLSPATAPASRSTRASPSTSAPPALKQLSAAETRGAPSLRELCNCAFRLRGRQADAEARALTLAELATIVFRPERQPGETHALAAALAEMGLARAGADYLWTPRVGPPRALSTAPCWMHTVRRSLAAAASPAPPASLRAMHLRQYKTDVSGRRPLQE